MDLEETEARNYYYAGEDQQQFNRPIDSRSREVKNSESALSSWETPVGVHRRPSPLAEAWEAEESPLFYFVA
jgi:hypothetical protein